MTQYEAVIKAMEDNGGFATLGYLYQHVLKIPGVYWGTKTPFASMRRIVQERPEIFRIRPGLWALKAWSDKLPKEIQPKQPQRQQVLYDHTYYQGLLLQIGKLKNFDTFVPAQDKNKKFLGKQKLGDIATIEGICAFGYDRFVAQARTIDVIWFNDRRMPASLFEIEHSTDIKNSLIKFVELQDFRTDMFIVADEARQRQFKKVMDMTAFSPIRKFVEFLSYERLSDQHAEAYRAAI